MKGCFGIILLVLLLGGNAYAQYSSYVISLTDKKGTIYTLDNPAAYLSPRAIERRQRQRIPLDSSDLPVSGPYLDSIRSAGELTVLHSLKWQNQVCIRTADLNALEKIRGFSFVRNVTQIAGGSGNRSAGIVKARERNDPARSNLLISFIQGEEEKPGDNQPVFLVERKETGAVLPTETAGQPETQTKGSLAGESFYGSSFNQIHIHKGDYLHEKGYMGEGMLIAMLDAGYFRYLTNPAFDSLRLQGRVVGEWDFVAGEQSVNEDHSHGMICLAMIAADIPGILVGSAPGASFLLLRTEDAATEMPIEEYNWAAAAEYADSAGADMISSSLGYVNFDDPAYNHSYLQRDGKTTIITRAANKAAGKGILVMSSAGNDGAALTDLKYVACPGDGDSVLAVGATNSLGVVAAFSDWGPNAAGKVKPDVVSVGENAFYTLSSGTPAQGSGTSLSNPNLAGLVACLWQAYPEFTNMEIMDAVRKSAHQYANPDNRYGYGIPDFQIAWDLLGKERSDRNSQRILGEDIVKAYPVPFKDRITLLIKPSASGRAIIRLMDITGRLIRSESHFVTQDAYSSIIISNLNGLCRGIYIIQYISKEYKTSYKLVK